jgi:hypothetical protein
MDISSGHQGPSDDEPLFVPDGFEAEHLEAARRTIASNTGARRVARRFASSVAGHRSSDPRQRLTRLIAILHGVGALFAIVISAVTGTWLIGLAVMAMVGLSLLTAVRLLHVIEQARAHELAQREQPQQRHR